MKFNNRLFLIILCLCFFSCVPNRKVIYIQDLPSPDEYVSKSGKLVPYVEEEYLLQSNDVVDITIKTTSAELNEILRVNDTESQLRNLGGLNSGDAFFLNGYSLDDDGIVDLPLLGELKLVGMSVKQAKHAVEESLKKFINKDNYYVRVRLGGVRYSALGEFNRPGKFTILQNRVTIFEAIANAGDMTTLARRDEIMLIRQYPDGVRTHTINLLNDKIMESEFFFIRPNDTIYASPLKAKQWGTGVTVAQSFQIVLSVITVILLYLEVIKN